MEHHARRAAAYLHCAAEQFASDIFTSSERATGIPASDQPAQSLEHLRVILITAFEAGAQYVQRTYDCYPKT